eukprot:1195802-Prorocentrum_minimum.AAC.3
MSGLAAEAHPNCCMLLSDVVGWSRYSKVMSIQDLVQLLNIMCTKFDAIINSQEGIYQPGGHLPGVAPTMFADRHVLVDVKSNRVDVKDNSVDVKGNGGEARRMTPS